jgi:hypothetical protein
MSLLLGLQPATFVSAGNDNATVVKTTAGQLAGVIHVGNVIGSPRYLKFYDKTTAPAPASDVPVFVFYIPASGSVTVPVPHGIAFKKGIAYIMVTGIANTDDTSTGAGDCIASFSYL